MATQEKKAIILLEDGTLLTGNNVGIQSTQTGELCFTTGMTGYQEIITDPSYFGQILIMNHVHIGNYGYKNTDVESSSIQPKALITRNIAEKFSRHLADGDLKQYFLDHQFLAVDGVDTRALVSHIRTKGAMNAIVSSEIFDVQELWYLLQAAPYMQGANLAQQVSTKTTYQYGNQQAPYKVAVYDFGVKQQILEQLASRGISLTVFPWNTPAEQIMAQNFDAYFLSNGPGDPAAMNETVSQVQQIINTGKPVFGICLGHQLLALANGVSTYKLHHGHRGSNHPVMNLETGTAEITTQNHGFGVVKNDVLENNELELTHINLNDDTVEGIRMKNKPVFSVQYHPEATPGPHDSRYLFDAFVELIVQHK